MLINEEFFEEIKDGLKQKNFLLEKIEEVTDGNNSKSFCLFSSKKKYLLKFFPKNELIVRDRLNSELNFLRFLNDIGNENIPKPIFWNQKKNFIVISWLEGRKIKILKKDHLKKLIDFIVEIQNNMESRYLNKIGNASEACFILSQHFKHIKKRIDLVVFKKQEIKLNYQNTVLLNNLIKTISKDYAAILENKLYDEIILEDNKPVPILSPSDIGFHNVLINKYDQLLFFDFEYAGWDDPHKTLSDLIIHPEFYMKKSLFCMLMPLLDRYVLGEKDKIRLEILLKLYRLKWALIILNNLIQNSDDNIDKLAAYSLERAYLYLDKSNRQINNFLLFQKSTY